MTRPKLGLVAVASHAESGGERGDDLLREAVIALGGQGVEVIAPERTVWDAAEALTAAGRLADARVDAVAVIHASWVLDSLQYLFWNMVRRPLILWAVPYTETFSLGCVQHFGSVLKGQSVPYWYAYGLPGEAAPVAEVARLVRVAHVARTMAEARVALIGPRQTWRAAGPQDMTAEEWDLTKLTGATLVHVEMAELVALAETQPETAAREVVAVQRRAGRLAAVEVEDGRLVYAAQVYLAVQELCRRYGLTAAAAECYPDYSGLVNLPASWLADQGTVLDTEGDLGHTLLALALNGLAGGGATALAEVGSLDLVQNCLCLAHEGSSAASLAERPEAVHILPGGERGTVVGFPFQASPAVTVTDLYGRDGRYQALVTLGATLPATQAEWEAGGRKFFAKLQLSVGAWQGVRALLAQGVDHHLLLKPGDWRASLADLCDLWGITKATV